MVGIVLVSHSPEIARGLLTLIDQLGGAQVPVGVAAGTPDGRLGTSADLVVEALSAADDGDGVVVIPDLGSAVMSVKVALEERDHEAGSGDVVLVDAPFVEGAVAAASLAGTGAGLAEVAAAAEQARHIPKV